MTAADDTFVCSVHDGPYATSRLGRRICVPCNQDVRLKPRHDEPPDPIRGFRALCVVSLVLVAVVLLATGVPTLTVFGVFGGMGILFGLGVWFGHRERWPR